MLNLWADWPFPKEVPSYVVCLDQGAEGAAGKRGRPETFAHFIIAVWLNRQGVEALVDTRFGRTLVKQVEGPPLSEMLQVKCIHSDVRDYPTVLVQLRVAG